MDNLDGYPLSVRPPATGHGNRTYELKFIQQPVRARMCGFGDKDRRPITPPPCIHLHVFQDGVEVDAKDINCEFYVLIVDLWSHDGNQQVSLVRHSSNSPAMSISAATPTSFPPPQDRFFAYLQGHAQIPSPANGVSMLFPQPTPAAYSTLPGYANTGAYPSTLYPSHPGYHGAPSYQTPRYGGPINAGAAVSNPNLAVAPYNGMNGYVGPTQAQVAVPQAVVGANGQPYGYTVGMSVSTVPITSATSTGQHTRNLIGSLAVSAAKLTDESGKLGIWFVLQDLSVRTEGSFRLRTAFVDVMDHNHPNRPTQDSPPILATNFSDHFQVYSAKKFPGVIESTPLSKVFAQQGIKIPIRKDVKPIANSDDFARDNDDPGSV